MTFSQAANLARQPDPGPVDQHLDHRAAAGGRPARHRRRPARCRLAAGPVVRAADRSGLRCLLLDLHRDAAGLRLQGAGAGVPAARPSGSRRGVPRSRRARHAAVPAPVGWPAVADAGTAPARSPATAGGSARRRQAQPAPAARRGARPPRPARVRRASPRRGPPERALEVAQTPVSPLDLEALMRSEVRDVAGLPGAGRDVQGHHAAARRPHRVRRRRRRHREPPRSRHDRQGGRDRGARLHPRPRRSPTTSAPGSSRSARPGSCRARCTPRPTRSSTARRPSRCIATRSSTASGCCSSTTSSPPVARSPRPRTWSAGRVARSRAAACCWS